MENKFTPELIEQAKAAESVEELLALAKENGVEMTAESAQAYYDQFHSKSGQLSDEELDNVAGGGCHASDGRMIVTTGYTCRNFHYNKPSNVAVLPGGIPDFHTSSDKFCKNCWYMSYENGLWLCNRSEYRK